MKKMFQQCWAAAPELRPTAEWCVTTLTLKRGDELPSPTSRRTLLPNEFYPGRAQGGSEEPSLLEMQAANPKRKQIAERVEQQITGASVDDPRHPLSLGEVLARKAGEVQAENKRVLDRAVTKLGGQRPASEAASSGIPKRKKTGHRGTKWTMI